MRNAYLLQLDNVRDDLLLLTRLVGDAVERATAALLEGDRELAEQVILGDSRIDLVREQVEEHSFELLSLQNPVASDLRMLVASLHMVGELERMGDLAVHVAKVARLRVPDRAVPADLAPLFSRMASLCALMVGKVEEVIADPDPDAARELEEIDEEMDRLRAQSFRVLLGPAWAYGVEPAVDIALLGRYYERIADHAVSVARRVVFLATGEQPAHP
ncbi:MAG TPA: phosphate signaling complex protein PhoU [Marmoricola sp.]|nr:phosphate signaling complex protein PhoU [Marmoricola sp.]